MNDSSSSSSQIERNTLRCKYINKMKEEDIVNCQFVPLSTVQKVLNLIENRAPEPNRWCKRNLLELQLNRTTPQDSVKRKWRSMYHIALSRAIYNHDWNKLLYLLLKSPIWEHHPKWMDELPIYIRALTILLMNHPSSKAQGLLNDYLHMVLCCRTDQDKKAVLKVILTLPEKILRTNSD